MRSWRLFTAATVMTSYKLFDAWIERPGPMPLTWQLPLGQLLAAIAGGEEAA